MTGINDNTVFRNNLSSLQEQNQAPPKPKNRLALSIVATVVGFSSLCVCCIGAVLGAIAIVFATQSETKYNRQDYIGAESSSQTAFVLSIISFSVSALGILIYLFFYAIGDATSISDTLGLDIATDIIDKLR